MSEDQTITATKAKDLLTGYVSTKCCARVKPSKNINITEIEMKKGFLYSNQSFTEKREIKWKYIPYFGLEIDDTDNGDIPEMWSIQVQKPNSFEKKKEKYKVPHSDVVKTCGECSGRGRIICSSCGGACGRYVSTSNGSNYQTCNLCLGSGRISCYSCTGTGKLLWYLQLKVFWKVCEENCVINPISDDLFPNKKVKKAVKRGLGLEVINESSPRVSPLYEYPDLLVKEATVGLNESIDKEYETDSSTILEQRHQLIVVHINVVRYEYKAKNDVFFIYGQRNNVYCLNYPGKCCSCCCLCTII